MNVRYLEGLCSNIQHPPQDEAGWKTTSPKYYYDTYQSGFFLIRCGLCWDAIGAESSGTSGCASPISWEETSGDSSCWGHSTTCCGCEDDLELKGVPRNPRRFLLPSGRPRGRACWWTSVSEWPWSLGTTAEGKSSISWSGTGKSGACWSGRGKSGTCWSGTGKSGTCCAVWSVCGRGSWATSLGRFSSENLRTVGSSILCFGGRTP